MAFVKPLDSGISVHAPTNLTAGEVKYYELSNY